jgi:hypothetical protein
MRTTGLAAHAQTPDQVKLWADLSLEESKLRRHHHVRLRTVLGLSGFAVVMYVSLVWAMTP